MKYLMIAAAAIFSLTSSATSSFAGSKGGEFTHAEEFAQELKSSGNFEIVSSGLALEHSDNDQIKQFAHKMIDDHQAADKKLTETLKQADLPEPDYAMTEEFTEKVQQLEALQGARFDRQYVQDQIQGHKDAIELLEGYQQRGDSQALKDFAATLLPTIKEHYELAQSLNAGGATARR